MFGFKKKKVEKEKKITKHQEELIKQFEDGMILQISNKDKGIEIDNKEYFKNIKKKEEVIEKIIAEEVKEAIEEDIQETNLDDLPDIEPPIEENKKEEMIKNE